MTSTAPALTIEESAVLEALTTEAIWMDEVAATIDEGDGFVTHLERDEIATAVDGLSRKGLVRRVSNRIRRA